MLLHLPRGAAVVTDPHLQLRVPLAPNLPKFVRDAVDAAADIYHRPQLFPEITGLAFAPKTRIRKRRRSLLRALALTVAALARRCDRRTFRVGDQRDDGLCNGVPVSELCRATGLRPTTQKRALATLRACGYQNSVQPVLRLKRPREGRLRRGRRVQQVFVGLASVRTLTPLLFRRLGFKARKVKRARARGYQEWIRRRAPIASAVQIHDARRLVGRVAAANVEREARLSTAGVATSPQLQLQPARTPGRLLDANEARDARLQQLLKPPPGV